MPAPSDQIEIPPGVLAITTYGSVAPETVQSLLDLRGHNSAQGINNVAYTTVQGHLVDKIARAALRLPSADRDRHGRDDRHDVSQTVGMEEQRSDMESVGRWARDERGQRTRAMRRSSSLGGGPAARLPSPRR